MDEAGKFVRHTYIDLDGQLLSDEDWSLSYCGTEIVPKHRMSEIEVGAEDHFPTLLVKADGIRASVVPHMSTLSLIQFAFRSIGSRYAVALPERVYLDSIQIGSPLDSRCSDVSVYLSITVADCEYKDYAEGIAIYNEEVPDALRVEKLSWCCWASSQGRLKDHHLDHGGEMR